MIRGASPSSTAECPPFMPKNNSSWCGDAKFRAHCGLKAGAGAHHTTPHKPQRLPARPTMSAAASLSHQQWEQQLSGIIERTNANLNALSTRYSPARPAESVRRSAERQSWDAFEERDRRPAPSESVETFAVDDDAIERSVARALARWNVGNVQGGDNALQRLEDEVATLRARRRRRPRRRGALGEATVDALAREVHARRGHASKMLAWQADAEQWRSRVDAQPWRRPRRRRPASRRVATAHHGEQQAQRDAGRGQGRAWMPRGARPRPRRRAPSRRASRPWSTSSRTCGGRSPPYGCGAASRWVETTWPPARQRRRRGKRRPGRGAAGFAAAESKLEDKLSKSLGSSLRAEASEALMDARRQLENTLDSRAAALGGGSSGSYGDDDRAAKAVDKAVAKLVGDVDSARNEVDELKRAREADLRDARLAQKKLEQQLEAVRAECADKIGQVAIEAATRTARFRPR